MPDINTLPPSARPTTPRNMSSPGDATSPRGGSPAPLSRTASMSLQAAAAVNAGLQHEGSRRMFYFPLQSSPSHSTDMWCGSGSSGSSTGRNRQSSHTGRRRSTVLMNLQLNDPNIPAPGEMVNEGHRTASPQSLTGSPIMTATADPHHRAPSLGEIHQELEQEQEAQVVSALHGSLHPQLRPYRIGFCR